MMRSRWFLLILQFKLDVMQEDKSKLVNYAMNGGLFLGLFWVVKYLMVMGGGQSSALNVISSLLSLGTPLLLVYFLVTYKVKLPNNEMGFWHGVQFTILLFFFASILEAVIVFIHITWIDTTYIGKLYSEMTKTIEAVDLSKKMVESLKNQPLPSSINYILSNVVFANIFVGMVLSLIAVPFVNLYYFRNFKSNRTQ